MTTGAIGLSAAGSSGVVPGLGRGGVDVLIAGVKAEQSRVVGEVVDESIRRSAELRERRTEEERERRLEAEREQRLAEIERQEEESARRVAERARQAEESAAERAERERAAAEAAARRAAGLSAGASSLPAGVYA